MRILHICDSLRVSSGVSTMVVGLYKQIHDSNIKMDFLFFYRPEADSYEQEIMENGSEVYYIETPLSARNFLSSVKKCKIFFKNNGNKYDIIHLHSPTINEFTLRYAKKYSNARLIMHSHSSMTSPNPIKKFINSILLFNVKKYATDFFACSTVAGEFLYGKKFMKKRNVELILNAVSPEKYFCSVEKYNALRKKYKIEDKTVVMHISNFSYIKNHMFLCDVIKECVEKNDKFLFIFVGEGVAKTEFENKINKMNLSAYVRFAGKHIDVTGFYHISDLLILPSLKEGLPLTAVEAQASGIPCFLSDTITREADVGGAEYIPLEKKYWIEKILSFKPYSDKQKHELSTKFKKSELNIENVAKKVQTIYESIK